MDPTGLLLSLVLFLINHVETRRNRDEDKTINGYLEWLRRRDKNDLVRQIEASRNEIEALLAREADLLASLSRDVLLAVSKRADDLQRKLEEIESAVSLSVFSKHPAVRRPYEDIPLVGRDDELTALLEGDSDVVVSGQPGIGKTFLLSEVAARSDALFVLTSDYDRVAAEVSRSSCRTFIIDDAALRLDLVARLQAVRIETGRSFRIITSCWPFDTDTVLSALGLGMDRAATLSILTRDDIVEIIKATGIAGPRELIKELVDQSANKPGLAVTLAHMCKESGFVDIASGDAIARDLRRTLVPIVGQEAFPVLAAFSLGGQAGLNMAAVASSLDIPITRLGSMVRNLAAGGVISEVVDDRLRVDPPALREALVKDVFFGGPGSLPKEVLESLLAETGKPTDTAQTLVGAASRGAEVDGKWLFEYVAAACDTDRLAEFAWLGPEETNIAIDHALDRFLSAPYPGLHHAPERTLPLLLDRAVGHDDALDQQRNHPLRLLRDWVRNARPGSEAAVATRQVVFGHAKQWLAAGRDVGVGLRAMQIAFDPGFENTFSDPGSGIKLTMEHGIIRHEDADKIQASWPAFVDLLKDLDSPAWQPMIDMVTSWANPTQFYYEIKEEYAAPYQRYAGKMLQDVAPFMQGHNGCMQWMTRMAEDLGVAVDANPDAEFLVLFPVERFLDDWEAEERKNIGEAEGLAREWAKQQPETIVRKIVRFEEEAHRAGITYPRKTDTLCQSLALEVSDPDPWISALMATDLPPDTIAPFLKRGLQEASSTAQEACRACLGKESHRLVAISIVITTEDVPEGVLQDALERMDDSCRALVETRCRQGHIPEDRMLRLLRHSDPVVAAAAAVGEWRDRTFSGIRDSLRSPWRNAIIAGLNWDYTPQSLRSIYGLPDLLGSDPTLARDWMRARFNDVRYAVESDYTVLRTIAARMPRDQRRELILALNQDTASVFPSVLTEDDPGLCQLLMELEKLGDLRLAPLDDSLDDGWIEKALMALDAGVSPPEIATAAWGDVWHYSGKASVYWDTWLRKFRRLKEHDNPGIKAVGEAGAKIAEGWRQTYLSQEEHERLHGFQ